MDPNVVQLCTPWWLEDFVHTFPRASYRMVERLIGTTPEDAFITSVTLRAVVPGRVYAQTVSTAFLS